MRTRVKICGITNIDDAQAVVNLGADAIGLVFYAKSPRNVSLAQAKKIVAEIPAFVTVTALFVDPEPELVDEVIDQVEPDLIQFHGQESAEFCRQFDRPYIKAIRMQEATDLVTVSQSYIGARGLLLDTYVKGVPGGTGEAFNWQWVSENERRDKSLLPIILAGGLKAENVSESIRVVRPWAVDVSGGVEDAPGQKSEDKIQQFINAVNSTI